MPPSEESGGSSLLNPSGPLVQVGIDLLPENVKELVKPGKTSDRIQHAIAWASRPDPRVIELHRQRDRHVQTFADVQAAPLAQKDKVAKRIAKHYRRRAALTGAITGLPGGLWALVAAGADVQLTVIYAVRMASMIAQAYGYDTSLLEEQAHLADVLALVAGIDSIRGVGNYLTREGLTMLIPEVLPKVLARASIEVSKDEAGKLVGKIIPGVGAVVGGAIDYGFIRAAGEKARAYYHTRYMQEHGLLPAGQPTLQQIAPPAASLALAATSSAASGLPRTGALTSPSRVAAPLPKKHRRSPERVALKLAIYSFFFLLATILACGALADLVYMYVTHLH